MVGAKCGGYACAWDLRLVVNVPNAALSAAKISWTRDSASRP